MRSSERCRAVGRTLCAAALGVVLPGCAQHGAEQLALRDRIEQGALTPEDTPRFLASERQRQALVASASDPVRRLASALDQQLMRAAGRGDVPAMRQLIQDGAQVNAVDEWGHTA
jgi:hypothetical protein